MSNRAATWIAFAATCRNTCVTLPQASPLPLHLSRCSLPQHRLHTRAFNSTHYLRRDASQLKAAHTAAAGISTTAAKIDKRSTARKHQVKTPEPQRQRRLVKGTGKRAYVHPDAVRKDVTAYCVAETYHLDIARGLLSEVGYAIDPFAIGHFPQVLHAQTPRRPEADLSDADDDVGDVFVFPSGNVVTWNVREGVDHEIVERILPAAATNSHLDKLETEDLYYLVDPTREQSKMVGDTVILCTKAPSTDDTTRAEDEASEQKPPQRPQGETALAKVAFSSALARSAKLAVLENLLSDYFASTRSIATTLSQGKKLNFTRAFILQKTGELLSIRAQLNLYSELTDSLPDIFWDSPHELWLEDYYEQVGAALDVGVRIKVLNEKMDYASEIAAVLRERLSEKHGTGLEWLIIGLISIEVGFGVFHLWRDRTDRIENERRMGLVDQWLEKELRK